MRQLTRGQESDLPPRYDSETVRQVLARASEIEAQPEMELMTAEQVETLGREIGLSPEAVRRALGEKVGGSVRTNATTSSVTVRQNQARPSLTQKQVRFAYLPTILYGLICIPIIIAILQFSHSNTMPANLGITLLLLISVVFPLCAAFRSGYIVGRGKIGSIGGLFTTVYSLVILVIAGYLGSPDFKIGDEGHVIPFLFLFGAIAGGMGALARRWWDSLAHNSDR